MDRQIKRVYAFEGEWERFCSESLNLPHFRLAVRTACEFYGVPAPSVRFLPASNRGDAAWYDPESHKIFVRQLSCRNMAIALHEAAHAIDSWLFGERNEAHGPIFLGIYFWLLVKMGEAPYTALRATAAEHNLKYIGAKAASPKGLRVRYAAAIRKAASERDN